MRSSDSGLYIYMIMLRDDQGYTRLETINVAITVISVEDIMSLSLDQLSTLDIDITLSVTNCKLRQVTKVKAIFVGEEEYYEEIIKKVISFDYES